MKKAALIILLAMSSKAYACDDIRAAHSNLLKSNFTLDKAFTIEVDEEKKLALKNNISFLDGVLTHSANQITLLSEDFKYDEDDTEVFLDASFSCEDVELQNDEVLITSSVDDKVTVVTFRYLPEQKLLLPLREEKEAEVGVMFMTWHIKSVANYSQFKNI